MPFYAYCRIGIINRMKSWQRIWGCAGCECEGEGKPLDDFCVEDRALSLRLKIAPNPYIVWSLAPKP